MGTEEFEEALKAAEVKLSRLRSLYEQWFAGIERIEPAVARKDLDRMIELLKREQPRNTALRFRLQQLTARYGTYALYWTRIAKQIEEGTYRRDLQRARERQKKARPNDAIEVDLEGFDSDLDLDSFGESDLDAILGALTSERPPNPMPSASFAKPVERATRIELPGAKTTPPSTAASVHTVTTPLPPRPNEVGTHASIRPPGAQDAPPSMRAPAMPTGLSARGPAPKSAATGMPPPRVPPPARPPAPPPPPRAPGAAPLAPPPPKPASPPAAPASQGGELRALYDRYLDARRKNNERVDNVKFETLQSSVEKMLPKLREKHGNKAIDFEVVVQDGKVGLKPKVRG